jgi:hypothetical protein
LEQIREYNALYQLLMDQGEDFDGYKGGRSLAEGTSPIGGCFYRGGVVVTDVQLPQDSSPSFVSSTLAAGPYYLRTDYANDPASLAANSNNLNAAIIIGERNRNLIQTDSNNTLGDVMGVVSLPNFAKPRRRAFTFCMPIVSGILGTGMPKYVPVGILNSDLRLELGLGPWEQAFKCVGRMYKNKVHIDPDACW